MNLILLGIFLLAMLIVFVIKSLACIYDELQKIYQLLEKHLEGSQDAQNEIKEGENGRS